MPTIYPSHVVYIFIVIFLYVLTLVDRLRECKRSTRLADGFHQFYCWNCLLSLLIFSRLRNPIPAFCFPFNYDLQKFKMHCQPSCSSIFLNLFWHCLLLVSFTLTSPIHLSGFYCLACDGMSKRKISKNHLMCAIKFTSNTHAAKIFISYSAENLKPWNQHAFKVGK